jgi:hypothetical protein
MNTATQHADLKKLWELADTAERPPGNPGGAATFGNVGLFLVRPPRRTRYASTPANTLAFAATGGDGVHFNFVLRQGEVHADSPIVMTVPMNFDRPLAIVGRDLRDFLSFGVGCGFFCLEQLTYDLDRFAGRHRTGAGQLDAVSRRQLHLVQTTFGLEPWTDPRSRLEELRQLEGLLEPPAPRSPQVPVAGPDAEALERIVAELRHAFKPPKL